MKSLTRVTPTTLLAFAILASLAVSPAAAKSFSETVEAADFLRVDLETGGAIRISTWGEGTISIEAEYSGPDAADVQLRLRRTARGVEFTSEWATDRRRRRSSGEVRIRVPEHIDLDLRTTGGELEIVGVDGEIEAETMGGAVELRKLRGHVDVTTMGGHITMKRSAVGGRVETMGGHINLEDICGSVETSTMGGNVSYKNVDETCGGECKPVKISTMGGHVNAPDAPCGADLETMGGHINIDRAEEYVQAKTMGGNITIGELDGRVHATTMGGEIEVNMVGRGGDARLDSKGGNVILTVPAGMGMDIDITIFYTKRSSQDFEIDADMKLDIRKSGEWDYSYDPPRKFIRARGRVGGGGHKVKIETVDGDVRLIQN